MQSLTSCQCSVCCSCFQQHFTIAVRDKHIRDMVCPVCWEPNINDPEHLNSYFSTLDIQESCLDDMTLLITSCFFFTKAELASTFYAHEKERGSTITLKVFHHKMKKCLKKRLEDSQKHTLIFVLFTPPLNIY